MTDRICGYTVVLKKDIREDDAEATTKAIEQIKGVLEVVPLVVDPGDYIGKARAKIEIYEKLLEVMKGI